MSQPIRGQGGHLVFPISPKNTNLVQDVEILLPVKFSCIPFSGFRGEVENVSANQRPGRPSCFSDRPEKHKRLNVFYQVCVFRADPKNKMAALASDWLRQSSETAEWNSTQLDRKQDLNVLFQVCVFGADRKNKMAALASD